MRRTRLAISSWLLTISRTRWRRLLLPARPLASGCVLRGAQVAHFWAPALISGTLLVLACAARVGQLSAALRRRVILVLYCTVSYTRIQKCYRSDASSLTPTPVPVRLFPLALLSSRNTRKREDEREGSTSTCTRHGARTLSSCPVLFSCNCTASVPVSQCLV